MSSVTTELEPMILRPTEEEVRNTRVLYFSYEVENTLEALPKIESLRGLGLSVTTMTESARLLEPLDFDFIFTTRLAEPFDGNEVLIPALGGLRGIAVLGPPPAVRAISEDKVVGKMMAQSVNVEVARHRVIKVREPALSRQYPGGRWILKPRTGVMSQYIGYIDDPSSWKKAMERATHPMHQGRDFLVEEFVPGLNIAVPVIEGLPIRSAHLERGETRHNILTRDGKEGRDASYDNEVYEGPGAAEARAAAARMAAAMSPFDYARFDFRYEPVSNRLVFLEVNACCAMGPYSVVARSARRLGLDHQTMTGHIFTHSLRRQRRIG
jgi:D-alanine-D-alanine ligase